MEVWQRYSVCKVCELNRSSRSVAVFTCTMHRLFYYSTLPIAHRTAPGLKPRKLQCVAVLGGGLMGSGIVTALVLNGYDAILKEVNQQFLEVGQGGDRECWEVWVV